MTTHLKRLSLDDLDVVAGGTAILVQGPDGKSYMCGSERSYEHQGGRFNFAVSCREITPEQHAVASDRLHQQNPRGVSPVHSDRVRRRR